MKSPCTILLITLVLLASNACKNETKNDSAKVSLDNVDTIPPSDHGVTVGGVTMSGSRNILDNLTRSKDHTFFAKAIAASGLDTLLTSNSSFTVFAPEDTAFSKYSGDRLESLLKPSNKNKLADLIGFHIVPGKFSAANLSEGLRLLTQQGQHVEVRIVDGEVKINGAKITIADVPSNNGVIHVIDNALEPASETP